jgi:D-alanine-D-alanine ligase
MTRDLRVRALGRVGVLMGGNSGERQVSLWSGETVLNALREAGVEGVPLDIRSAADLFALPQQRLDRVFNVMHGSGEDGRVQALLELMRIPYPGTGVLASALAMDKLQTKRLWRSEGLPTADWAVVPDRAALDRVAADFGYPFFLKPAADGSSVGISKIRSADQLDAAWASARSGLGVVLAERFVPGGEFTCAVVNGRALPLIRIEPDGEFYDYHAKYLSEQTRYHCPSGLAEAQERELQALCLRAFEVIGARTWGRVDFLMAEDGRPSLLEINTLPGMTSHSLVPMAARAAGISIHELVLSILAESLPTEAVP